jgi:hypothetical protein
VAGIGRKAGGDCRTGVGYKLELRLCAWSGSELDLTKRLDNCTGPTGSPIRPDLYSGHLRTGLG